MGLFRVLRMAYMGGGGDKDTRHSDVIFQGLLVYA